MYKHTIEDIRKIYFEKGCDFLSKEYSGVCKIYDYKCTCGEIHKGSVSNFRAGYRSCASGKIVFWNLEKVKKYFKQYECEFLDDWFDKIIEKHNFKCRCGRIDKISVHHFKRHKRCGRCGKTKKYTTEEIKQRYKDQGCEFLDTKYINNRTSHKYLCRCGNIHHMRPDNFFQGKRCKKCSPTGGFLTNKPSYLYLLKKDQLLKAGIYNQGTRRIKDHMLNGWEQIDELGPLHGSWIQATETVIFQKLKSKSIPLGSEAGIEKFDGYTECWRKEDFDVSSLGELWEKL